ncbi:fanconi anemia group I protein [Schistosoma bovis]|uniref:Fanconi anemia group I protein n=1 Tax=Schistosoma bovis TaxID=6184 RepID=A0A430QQX1_SCHBO|nr:fanconi anemia group I protein [Schistosoma bovis]
MDTELENVLGNLNEVSKLLLNKSFQEVVNYFDKLLRSDKSNRLNSLEALLGVSKHEQLLEIYEHVVDFLWSKEVDTSIRLIFFSFLNNNLDFLEDWKVERLCFRMIRKLIYVCSEPSLLQQKSMEKILEKALSKITSWELDKRPIFIQSILLFSFPRYMEFLFLQLTSLIYGSSSCPPESFEVIRGQLMMKIFSLVKANQQFGKTIFETVKVFSLFSLIFFPHRAISRLNFLIFSVLIIFICHIFIKATQLLTTSILTGFSDSHLVLESSFLRDLCRLPDDPKEIILKLSEHCTSKQWEFTVQGMILLGFTLLRAACSSSTGSTVNKSSGRLSKSLSTSPFQTHDTLKSRILCSGLDLLLHIFKFTFHYIKSFKKIIVSSSAFPDLLSNLVAVFPLEVAIRANRLDSIIDSIGLIPLSISTALVHALLPLIRAGSLLEIGNDVDSEKSDSPFGQVRMRLISNLCKAAQSPRIPSRCAAVACLIILLKHLKIAQQAVLLPCDIVQNEVLCTEIISILHRIIFSAFFRSQPGSLLADPENIVKSNIYWLDVFSSQGLCEVVTRNRGLCEPVLNLYLRLLTGCLEPNFLKTLKRSSVQNSLNSLPTQMNPSNVDFIYSPPFILNKLIDQNSVGNEILRTEHPDILIWCLQLILTLPIFNLSWKRLHSRETSNSGSELSQISSDLSSETASQFTQSTLNNSIQCGRLVTYPLFSKAVNLLISISDSLRLLSKEDFGLTTETDFSSSAVGKLNRDRVHLLINIYDACLEFELKDPLGCGVTHINSNNNLQSQFTNQNQNYGILSPLSRHGSESRCGLLIMSLVSLSQANLKSILIASIRSDSVNPLACHVLQTISNRLNQFTRCAEGDIPCAYRDALISEMGPIMKCVIRFYHYKIMLNENCSSLPSHTQSTNITTTIGNSEDNELTNQSDTSKTRPTSSMSTSSTALQVINNGMTLALHYLGIQRLHKLCKIIYPVTNDPDYTEQMLNNNSDVPCDSEDNVDDESLESMIAEITPAQALSTFIKLVKSWVTKVLNPASAANSSTQKLTAVNFPHAKDLVILLPLLVKLCRARASIGSEVTIPDVNKINPYSGLSRVLAWLLRLMRAPIPLRGSSEINSTNVLATSARVQLINQAIWLAHLIGSNSLAHNPQTLDAELALDDLILALSSDLTTVLGNVAGVKDISLVPDDKELTVTYPLVTRSSALSILPLIYSSIKHSIHEYEWFLTNISIDCAGRLDMNDGKGSIDIENKLDGNEKEESFCLRLIGLGEILAQLLQTALPAPSAHVDTLLEIGASVFNLLSRLTKYYLRIVRLRYGRFPVIFERLVRVYGREVAPRAYVLFSYIQINLMRNVKLSTARDFRINQAAVIASLEQSTALSLSSLSDNSEPDEDTENLNNDVINANDPTEREEGDTNRRSDDDNDDDKQHRSSHYQDDNHVSGDENNVCDDIDLHNVMHTNDIDENVENISSNHLSKSRTTVTPAWGRVS